MNDMDKMEKPRKDYFKKEGIKTCRNDNHVFNIQTEMCEHKHCSKCGVCQAVNGCFQIVRTKGTAIFEIGKILNIEGMLMWTVKDPMVIIKSYEYKIFKQKYPELCRLAEGDLSLSPLSPKAQEP